VSLPVPPEWRLRVPFLVRGPAVFLDRAFTLVPDAGLPESLPADASGGRSSRVVTWHGLIETRPRKPDDRPARNRVAVRLPLALMSNFARARRDLHALFSSEPDGLGTPPPGRPILCPSRPVPRLREKARPPVQGGADSGPLGAPVGGAPAESWPGDRRPQALGMAYAFALTTWNVPAR